MAGRTRGTDDREASGARHDRKRRRALGGMEPGSGSDLEPEPAPKKGKFARNNVIHLL